jgi:hypothetical protein
MKDAGDILSLGIQYVTRARALWSEGDAGLAQICLATARGLFSLADRALDNELAGESSRIESGELK